MSSSPGQSKECLPPKKRESRQSSVEQCPTDTFKRPAPYGERTGGRRGEQHRESGEEVVSNSRYSKDLTPPLTPPLSSSAPPTPLPAPVPMFTLPWSMPYPGLTASPFLSDLRRDPRNPATWRGQGGRGADFGDSSWSSPLEIRHTSVPAPYRTHYPTDVFTCLPVGQRDYSSPVIAHPSLFSRPLQYPRDPTFHNRAGLSAKRPNGFDRTDGWYPHSARSSDSRGYGHQGHEKQETPCGNGKRGCLGYQSSLMRALSEEALDTPSASQGKDPRALPKTPPPSASGTRAVAYNLPGPPGQARMYYALTHTSAISQQRPLLDPHFSPPGLASLRDSEFSRLVESKDPEALKPLQQGPNEDLSPNDSQRFSSPSPGGYRQKAATPTRLNPPDPSPPPPGSPIVQPHFRRGSLIDLGGGRLKRVEDLQTEDFLLCPNPGPDVHLSTCTILLISPSPDSAFTHLQVLLPDHSTQELPEVLAEYPFFVRNRGWSSCCPQRTAQVYGLRCHQLRVGGKGFGPQYIHAKADEEKVPARSPPTPPKELPRTRKRRWSAPELRGEDTTPQELPHSSKHRRQQ
ncbi:hypothetical protein MATL_G00075040 [Megalops atlanticus]|uniref:AXH domain-containing protein n=1 Tax=Megalops atlanticus TaxID=7932 RepID=A0A9D3TF18_MEGAT|nr:hypothetical protein MATL_G00075040 [Megalops atlanticus]